MFNDDLETYYDFLLPNLQPSTDYVIKLKVFNSIGSNATQIVRRTDEKSSFGIFLHFYFWIKIDLFFWVYKF